MFDTAMGPLRQNGPFDLADDLLEHCVDNGLPSAVTAIFPMSPARRLFLHRKIGGNVSDGAKLRARIGAPPMVEAYCDNSTSAR